MASIAAKLRRQNWWLEGALSLGIAGLLGLLYLLAVSFVTSSLNELERVNLRKDVRRSLDAIATETEGILTSACDYAHWDDAYRYMATGNRAFELDNFNLETSVLRLNVLAAVLPDGRFRYSQSRAGDRARAGPLLPSVRRFLAAWPQRHAPLQTTSQQAGWLQTEGGPMVLALCAVSNRNGTATPRGLVAMGRTFGPQKIAAIERQLRVKMTLLPLGGVNQPEQHRRLSAPEQAIAQGLLRLPSRPDASIPDAAIVVNDTSDNRIAGYVRLDELTGRPFALLRIETARDLHHQGILASRFLGGSLAVAGLAFGLVAWGLLRRLLAESQRLARSEEALARESALRIADDLYRQKAIELEIALGELNLEKERSERLLLNMLPEAISRRLKNSRDSIAESFDEVTILFADIVGFTTLSARLEPIELVDLLNRIFSQFDDLAEQLKLEKIKTIGDAYMVAAGLPLRRRDHATAIAEMALAMQQAIANVCAETGEALEIRIGINTGVVVAGVIGTKKFIYDLWGDAVNVASRMESSGSPGRIQVTDETYLRLRDRYHFEERGSIVIKGKGEMKTYWLCGKKTP